MSTAVQQIQETFERTVPLKPTSRQKSRLKVVEARIFELPRCPHCGGQCVVFWDGSVYCAEDYTISPHMIGKKCSGPDNKPVKTISPADVVAIVGEKPDDYTGPADPWLLLVHHNFQLRSVRLQE